MAIQRRVSRQIRVGKILVGGDAPISVQSMTNTVTTDITATLAQINALVQAGADMVRISIPDLTAAEAFGQIKAQVTIPLITDIHFDYRIALRVAALGADCLRINPGNIGREDRVQAVVSSARDHGIPIRIGVNAGSLEKDLQKKYGEPTAEALIESALRHIDYLDRLNFQDFKISLKSSDVSMTVAAYRALARQIEQPLHLGVTEAGAARAGTVKSAIAMGILLSEGIGDTLRVSLAADPVEEIKVGFDILKSLGLRNRGVHLIVCPSCARQSFDVIATANALEQRLSDIKTPITVAVLGCVVNGPGEAREAKVGLVGGSPHLIYIDGVPHHKVGSSELIDELEHIIRGKNPNIKMLIDRYIAREINHTLVAIFGLLMVILVSHQFVRYLADAAAGEIPGDMLFMLIGLKTISFAGLVLPLSLFLAVIVGLGRLYRDSEMVVMTSCGIGPTQILKSVIRISLTVVFVLAILSFYINPWASEKRSQILDQAKSKPELSSIIPGRFQESMHGDIVYFVERVNTDGSLNNVFIQYHRPSGLTGILSAPHGYPEVNSETGDRFLVLINGHRYEDPNNGNELRMMDYGRHGVMIPVPKITASGRRQEAISTSHLMTSNALIDRTELQWRWSLPISAMLLAALGVPLSRGNPREGRYGKLFTGILIYLIFSNLLSMGRNWMERGKMPAYLGVWWVYVLLLILVIVLHLIERGVMFNVSQK